MMHIFYSVTCFQIKIWLYILLGFPTRDIPVVKEDYVNIVLPTFGWLLRKAAIYPLWEQRECIESVSVLITSLEKKSWNISRELLRLSFILMII